jgi:hypothetical protein
MRSRRYATGGMFQVDRYGNPYGPLHYYLQRCPSCRRQGRPAESMGGDPAATTCTVDGATTPRPQPRVMAPAPGWTEWQASLDPAMRHPDYVHLLEHGELPVLPFTGPWPAHATWGDLRHYDLILGPS